MFLQTNVCVFLTIVTQIISTTFVRFFSQRNGVVVINTFTSAASVDG